MNQEKKMTGMLTKGKFGLNFINVIGLPFFLFIKNGSLQG